LHAWAREQREDLAEALAEAREHRSRLEARQRDLRTRYAKTEPGADADAILRESRTVTAELQRLPERVAAPDLVATSFTPEALRELLALNGQKAGIVSAEADPADVLGIRYDSGGAGPNLDVLLAGHAGDPVAIRRAKADPTHLDRPAVAFVLAVQPEAMRSVLANRVAQGRGLVSRFLLLCPPSRMGSRDLDPAPVPEHLLRWWGQRLRAVLDLPWPGRIMRAEGQLVPSERGPRVLALEPEARDILWSLRKRMEPRLAPGADLEPVRGFVSKLHGACARLALAFAILREPYATAVDGAAMSAACAWADLLLDHHRAAVGQAVERPEVHHARRLLEALRRRGKAEVTARDAFALARTSALPDMASMRPVLDLLEELGWLRRRNETPNGPGRPRGETYDIHPAAISCVL
jgi:putative DNA primase/helicase